MEHYYTIQGEGFNAGKPCYFIRIGGCEVGCHWCDVKESWNADSHKQYSPKEMLDWIEKSGNTENIVITGGEPTQYNLAPLTKFLIEKQKKVWIETSGAFKITGDWHWICLSPKKRMPALAENCKLANELKVIIYNQDDFDWAEKYRKMVPDTCILFLQPEWSKKDEMMPKIVDYVKKNSAWRISIQTHKYMNIP